MNVCLPSFPYAIIRLNNLSAFGLWKRDATENRSP